MLDLIRAKTADGTEISLSVNVGLTMAIEEECGVDSFVDAITLWLSSIESGKMSGRLTVQILRAGLRSSGLDPALSASFSTNESLRVISEMIVKITSALSSDPDRPIQAAEMLN